MRLLASAVCDHASTTPDGKLDVHGIFHDLYAPGFPARQDRMTLVLAIEWDQDDHGRHSFRVNVRGPGGRPTITVEGQSEVTARPAGRPPPRTQLVMPLEDVVFPVPGCYDFEIKVKGHVLKGPVLHLVEVDGEPEAGSPASGI